AKFFCKDGQMVSQIALPIPSDSYRNKMPVSYDGKKVYLTNWTKPYVSCYDIESGTLVWANNNKDIQHTAGDIELLNDTLVCEVFEIGVCLIDATTGEIKRWLLRNSGLSVWRITRELIFIWNRYKMKAYCYDIENDVLRILPTDFNAKKHFKELADRGDIPAWNVHFAMQWARVEAEKLKVRYFISHYDFEAEFFEEVPMPEVIGKGKVFIYKPKKKA
ncbi:MAG: hypothetical protein K2N18_01140, partial [Clostridia bacterium]|nr:hypothetical protein [Clostridia bacterium]